MDTFVGHIVLGIYFFAYGIFYVIKDAYVRTKQNTNFSRQTLAHNIHNSDDTRHTEDLDIYRDKNHISRFEKTVYSREFADAAIPLNSDRSFLADDADDAEVDGSESDALLTINGKVTASARWEGAGKECMRTDHFDWIEGVLKIVCSLIGLLGELWWVDWYMISPRTGNFTNMNRWQHATMFAFFGLSGIIDIVFQTCLKTTPPSNRGKIFLSLAFWVEYLLFSFHDNGVSELELDLHRLLLEAIGVCGVVSCLDVWCYRPGAPGVRRVWVTATCLQGTWFWQIAFTLYNPWREGHDSPWESPRSHMMLTSLFTFHLLFVLLLTTLINALVRTA